MRSRKIKAHRFTVVVKNRSSRRSAELALLSAFALRKPDGCMFQLLKHPPKETR